MIRPITKRRMGWVEHVARVGFWVRNLKERTHREDQGVDGKSLCWILKEIDFKGVEWIGLAPSREKLRAVVNTEMNCRVSKNAGSFWTRVRNWQLLRKAPAPGSQGECAVTDLEML
jgi:hypothetical protein